MNTEMSTDLKEFLFESVRSNKVTSIMIPLLKQFKIVEYSKVELNKSKNIYLIINLFNHTYCINWYDKYTEYKVSEVNVI